jgi:HEAT repeats
MCLCAGECRSVREEDLLTHLIELLGDKDRSVRAEVVRAVEQVGSMSAALLLRLRAVLGKDEPEVLGACYAGILRIEGVRAIPWVGHFLGSGDDSGAEAALAIAGTHSPESFAVLRDCLPRVIDPWFRSVVLSSIALTRQDKALEFLLDLIRKESLDAEGAIEAILRSMPSLDAIERLKKLVSGNPRLKHVFAAQRASQR